nr:retrovirus-related Pol polyprotein from transposon TNT 1-94 [Tanacetum cinerariifolium]
LVPNIIPQKPCNPPKRDYWDTLFQPLFDEYFNPPTIDVSTVPVTAAPRAVEIADSPVSTSIDKDAPSLSIPSIQDQEHSLIISQGVKESPKTPLFHDDPLHEFLHKDSISQGSSSNDYPSHVYKLKKALYGLKQAPRAWYDMLSSFLISQHFSKGTVDPILFTWKVGNDLLLDADMSLTAYSDVDHVGCQDTRRITSGSAQFLGDKLISWSSKKQKRTACSSPGLDFTLVWVELAQVPG